MQIGPYRVSGEIARGGMGVVYRASEAATGREVAIKVLLGGGGAGEVLQQRFQREAEALGRLNHPNIVRVHSIGEPVGRGRRLVCDRQPPDTAIRPSCDRLFRSVAEAYGPSGMGIILTGMGRDGAEGLQALRRAKGRTLAQTPETCVVAGMPRAAIDAGAIEDVLSLEAISQRIEQAAPPKEKARLRSAP